VLLLRVNQVTTARANATLATEVDLMLEVANLTSVFTMGISESISNKTCGIDY
jgi:hypothetical protein